MVALAENSRQRAAFAREIDRYSPAYREGEILAMGANAHVYKLTQRVTGADPKGVERFLRKLDRTQMPTIGEATDLMHERADARQACAQLMSILNPIQTREFEPSMATELRHLTRDIRYVVSQSIEAVERPLMIAGGLFEVGAGVLESLFGRALTPEQKAIAHIAEREHKSTRLKPNGSVETLFMRGDREHRCMPSSFFFLVPAVEVEALARATAALNRAAGLLNQIAKRLNSAGSISLAHSSFAALSETRAAVAEILHLVGRFDRI